MRHALVTTLENTPVIPAVKTPEELPAALRAEGGVVFLLCGDILNIGELIARVHAASRRAVVHADLVAARLRWTFSSAAARTGSSRRGRCSSAAGGSWGC